MLSVVIPTFDTAQMTLHCCRAVLASMPLSKVTSTEVIVVDDGSRDGTAELLAREPVRVVRLETNRGFATAANAGVAAASGEVILLLNSDAIVEAGALDAIAGAFDDPTIGVAGAQLLHPDGTPQWSGGPTPTLPWMLGAVSGLGRFARHFRSDGAGAPRAIDWVSGAAMAFRREVWSAAGPLNERYRFYCQDIDFCLRARAVGWGVRVIADARVTHALSKTIGSGRAKLLRRDLLDWGAAHYGPRWAMLARPLLAIAGAWSSRA